MIYAAGDTHCPRDIHKLNAKKFPEQRKLTKNDYLIVLGDFGLFWDNVMTKTDLNWMKWLNDKKFTTLFLDGNHENHQKLFSGKIADEIIENNIDTGNYILEKKFGGYVGKMSDSIYHLRRGEIYNIDSKKFFIMGGAYSIDKLYRLTGVTWWPEEEPNFKEYDYGLNNLKKHNNKVDYILGHTAPQSIIQKVFNDNYKNDSVTKFFDHIISFVKFNKFYCGHFHEDKIYDKYHFLFEKVELLL